MNLDGICEPGFGAVADALIRNFELRNETGSAIAVFKEGRCVVDLWAGHLDEAKTRPWTRSTITILYSIAKSICALSAHMLIDEGLIELDAPVAEYWPEFGENGKDNIVVRHMLSHHDGMCFPVNAAPGDIFHYEKMIDGLQRQEAAWPPGSIGAYNSVTYGFLVGELVRRVSGVPINRFIRERICEPLDVDYWFGVPRARLSDVADIAPNPSNHMYEGGNTPGTNLHRAWQAMPSEYGVDIINAAAFREAMVPSFGGHGAARGIGRIYAALATQGTTDGVRLLSPEAVEGLSAIQWETDADAVLGRPIRMGLGFWRNEPTRTPMGPNPRAFGHPGSGGSLAFADPDTGISFCTQTAYLSEGGGVGDRTRALVDAIPW